MPPAPKKKNAKNTCDMIPYTKTVANKHLGQCYFILKCLSHCLLPKPLNVRGVGPILRFISFLKRTGQSRPFKAIGLYAKSQALWPPESQGESLWPTTRVCNGAIFDPRLVDPTKGTGYTTSILCMVFVAFISGTFPKHVNMCDLSVNLNRVQNFTLIYRIQ